MRTLANYFVDEAGDTTLFDRKGKVLVGTEGVSRIFMVGVAHLPDPQLAEKTLTDLRAELLSAPYFKGVPSLRPSAKKTALYFHAKDDVPEVRYEVFKLLPGLNTSVQIALRRKTDLAAAARIMSKLGHRYRPNDIYDDLVRMVFRNLLDDQLESRICFASRGKSNRERSLRMAIAKARIEQKDVNQTIGVSSLDEEAKRLIQREPLTIVSAYPHEFAGLQVVDYYLWALQRLYERNEDRFFETLREGYKLVMDLDDQRRHKSGEWYTENNPLHLKKLLPVAG